MGLQSLIAFSPSVYFGDTELTRSELEALLGEENGLAFLKGKWIEINKDRISQILSALDKVEGQDGLTFAEALKMQAGISDLIEMPDETELGISNGEWLSGVVEKMRNLSCIAI